ncbi:MAG: acyl carrier protein [Paracoccus sp. (in: a-proteobacteria)]|nr:acyl carrier protein [Paracoccus sp. (in: a-proteobacteria)]
MTQDVKTRIRAIIAEQAMLEPDQITDDATPEALGIDSLGLVETIFALEEEFDITIPFNANEPEKSEVDFSDMGAIVAAVEKLVAEKGQA